MLADYTTLGLGGPARYFIEPSSEKELIGVVLACSQAKIQMRVIGGGSNLLIRETGFDGRRPLAGLTSVYLDEHRRRLRDCGGGAK